MKFLIKYFLLASLPLLLAFRCQSKSSGSSSNAISFAKSYDFSQQQLSADLNFIAASPHPLGSPRQKIIGDYLVDRGSGLGLTMTVDSFIAEVPNPVLQVQADAPAAQSLSLEGRNIYGHTKPEAECVLLIGSHYDTKRLEGISYKGANDSGSSSAALLELGKALLSRKDQDTCSFLMIWFDGEEAYLENWNDGLRHPFGQVDNTYGSRHLAAKLLSCDNGQWCLPEDMGGQKVLGLLLLDMIGSPNVSLTRDTRSTSTWLELALQIDTQLESSSFGFSSSAVDDDHIPFIERGLPALNLIDFNHLQYWHREGDDVEQVDLGSIEKVLRLALATSLSLADEESK